MMHKYAQGNRFYCTSCRSTFFMPQDQGYIKSTIYCPVCGEHKAKYTSSYWWIEKLKKGQPYNQDRQVDISRTICYNVKV